MSGELGKLLSLGSLILTFASLVLLMVASLGVPWDKQTFDGNSAFEVSRKRRQSWTLRIGTLTGAVAIAIQAVVVLYGP